MLGFTSLLYPIQAQNTTDIDLWRRIRNPARYRLAQHPWTPTPNRSNIKAELKV